MRANSDKLDIIFKLLRFLLLNLAFAQLIEISLEYLFERHL